MFCAEGLIWNSREKQFLKAHAECQSNRITAIGDDTLKKLSLGHEITSFEASKHILCLVEKAGLLDYNGELNRKEAMMDLNIITKFKMDEIVKECNVRTYDDSEDATIFKLFVCVCLKTHNIY
ncbi:unnamed protein product [Psylliodes chrysocephalus]|uniref:Uncharacterized protein n=1 Tax=Psylliodes chrysocephalus TaxID=3402493 RepID=A0A9P0CVE8_9CUCU|nr:unnamed protein product [Psylliodes chrysocephala]